MIQPYFKPDENPSMPAFAVFYNGYFQERSKMNMQIMNLMLQQASPQYLTSMIEKTQGNIAELQKTRSEIIKGTQDEATRIALAQARLDLSAKLGNARLAQAEKKIIINEVMGGKSSRDDYSIKKQTDLTARKSSLREKLVDDTILFQAILDEYRTPRDRAVLIDLLDESKSELTKERGDRTGELNKLDTALNKYVKNMGQGITRKSFVESQFGTSVPSVSSEKESGLEELGFTLTPSEIAFGDGFIAEKNGRLEIKEFQKGPYINRQYSTLPDNEKDIVQKRMKQRILQQKKGYVRAPRIQAGDTSLSKQLEYIDEQLKSESEKLTGYLTRYDVGQQDVLEKMFAPFDSNYRTQNLFVRKSPEVLEQEKQIREMQYKDKTDTPSGYEKIKYNTEYQAPGGLNFGITKVGTEEIPYIFEGGTPYEIPQSDPSHSFILELLKEQDRKLGGRR